ncbi:hypothetical protein [Kozakia baliensis]|uniref:Uncharacterized protein n=1 Tax=Kozakia baliensis TaxID=153496 RepID=A0A1D8UXX5_9PROT|nr:hypothetical protein [Kozakia baliensis]AOX18407.1 hypothetical protein A0U89_13890 [Kozakia baliensis]GBR34125.1 hypothetical protein AA0488_2824 [Kozakia baliensis NRIC 0488]GEL65153.1 hypothetical protein KBA01_24390 [Kozakia baliensis]
MTTITIQRPGLASITITVGDAVNDLSLDARHEMATASNVAPPFLATPNAPREALKPSWKRHINHYVPGLAVGILGGLLIVGTRGPSLPDASAQQVPTYGYGASSLPPLSGGPVRSVGMASGMPPHSAGQEIEQYPMLQPDSAGAPGGYGSIAQSSTTPPPRGNQGGAPTESGAPVDGLPPVDGAPQPRKGTALNKPPFGLEP